MRSAARPRIYDEHREPFAALLFPAPSRIADDRVNGNFWRHGD